MNLTVSRIMPAKQALLSISVLAGVALCAVQTLAGDITFKVMDNSPRRAQTVGTGTANLYYAATPTTLSLTPWAGKYKQTDTDPFFINGCSAVAGRNLLSWYGEDPAGTGVWRTFEADMGINHAAQGVDPLVGCTGVCAHFVGIPGCTVACLNFINTEGNKGARQSAFVNAMARWTPPGTKMFYRAHRNTLDTIMAPLSEGNPPVAIINTAPKVNHFVVITGVYQQGGRTMVRLANNADLDWATFERKWARLDFGNDFERSIMDEVVGEKPYFLAWFSKATGRELGKYCTAHNECLSGLCDPRPDAGCVPNRNGQAGDICTDHAQCTSRICAVPPGSYVGKCAVPGSLPLGASCNTHDSCATRRCDNRPGAGCVNRDGQGASGDFCTTHQQCRTGVCLLSTPIAGKCR